MSILLISNMYPGSASPHYGIFVKRAESALKKKHEIDRIVIDNQQNNYLLKLMNYFYFYIKIFFTLLSSTHDEIYIHYVSHCSFPIILAKYFRPKLNLISHVHGGDIKFHNGRSKIFFKIKKNLSTRILNISNRIIVPSLYYKELIISEFGTKKDLIVVYPSGGIDTKKFNFPVKPRDNIIKLGFAGRFVKSKNVDLVLDIFSNIAKNNSNIVCELVGDGPSFKALKEKVNNEDLNDRVEFFPPKSTEELSVWYQSIDILIYPSDAESLGLVPLEAMSSGVMVFLSDIPAFREYIDNGKNGFICKKEEDYIYQIENVINKDKDYINKIRHNARSTVLAKYDSEVVSKRLYEVFS